MPPMLLNAFSIYIKSPKAYEECRKILILPSIRHMRRLSSFLKPDAFCENENIKYLKSQVELLKEKERIVTLKIDEVSLAPSLNFQSEQVFGYAENSKTDRLANSCQAFLISSLFSKYQDVVKLMPVKSQTANQLKNVLLDVLNMLFDVGFKVVAITSDNHSTNRQMFYSLCGGNSRLDTRDRNHAHYNFEFRGNLIHIFFDGPHIWKCIRNNWINLNNGKVFYYPSHPDLIGDKANFEVIRSLYFKEQKNVTKYAHKLNSNCINPTSWGRQNVKMALNIVHASTSSGLIQYAEEDPTGHATSTASFLKLFDSMWEVLNIKTRDKSYH